LGRLASRHGISLAELKQVNGITGRTRITPGTELLLPTKGAASGTAFVPTADRTLTKIPHQRKSTYVVKRGDTLWSIAQRFDVSIDSLRLWNHTGQLLVGQRLVIHSPAIAL
jgi:membrane-bound lytic murein transglycosylase D